MSTADDTKGERGFSRESLSTGVLERDGEGEKV